MENGRIKTCYISAPFGADLSRIMSVLGARNVSVLNLDEAPRGRTIAEYVTSMIDQADLVVGVLDPGLDYRMRSTERVHFEIGYAAGRDKRILIFASPNYKLTNHNIEQFPLVRAGTENRDAIDFALSQVIAAPERTSTVERKPRYSGGGIDERATSLIAKVRESSEGRGGSGWSEGDIELILVDAIRASGVELIVPSGAGDAGFDLAVWLDGLDVSMSNPLFIEVKSVLRSRNQYHQAEKKLAQVAQAAGSVWSLLVYGEVEPNVGLPTPLMHTVLSISIVDLLEAMRSASFASIVLDLRNRRAHGDL